MGGFGELHSEICAGKGRTITPHIGLKEATSFMTPPSLLPQFLNPALVLLSLHLFITIQRFFPYTRHPSPTPRNCLDAKSSHLRNHIPR